MVSRVVKYLPLTTVDIRTTKGPGEWARIDNVTVTAAGFIHCEYLDKELLQRRGKKASEASAVSSILTSCSGAVKWAVTQATSFPFWDF